MGITILRRVLTALAVAVVFAGGVAHAQSSPAAQRVLDRARAASGGAGWNTLRGLHETGQDGGQRYERWSDPIRYGARTETYTPAGKQVQGYNGAGEWRILASGVATGSSDRGVLAEVRSDAFFGAYAYFYPSRFDVRGSLLGVRESQGRSFDVVRLEPVGGKARQLWFDRKTGLLGQMVEDGAVRPLTVEVSDYRRVGGVLVPFKYSAYGGALSKPRERVVESLDFRAADRDLFSLPRTP